MNESLNNICDLIPEVTKQIQINASNIEIIDNNLKKSDSKHGNEIKDETNLEKRINEIEEKLKDMNIMGMFNLGGEEGDVSNAMKLINNLEKTFSEKINVIEKKLKQIEESNYRNNNNVGKILNTFDLNKRNFEHFKESIESLENKIDTNDKNLNNKIDELNTKIDNKIVSLEKNIEEIKNHYENKLNTEVEKQNVPQNKEDEKKLMRLIQDNKEKINELTEHLTELDKHTKLFIQKSGIDQIKTEISNIKTAVWKCSTLEDVQETKEREEELQKQISMLKEQIDDLSANQIDHEDYSNYKRRFEIVINKINDLETNFEELLNKKNLKLEKNKKNEGKNKYLEIKRFEEFKTQIIKEFSNVNDNFNLIRGITDKLSDAVNTKTSFNDFKVLEENFDAKLEDIKLSFSKKFAERVETNKNIKFLDQQIKTIIQFYIKKNEKDSNNWLLAKKPINSNLCASCDSYLGDLKENSNYVPWNKYPNRESEKLYRLGNGFSKMLQLVQVDENDKKNLGVNQVDNITQCNEINREENNKNFEKGLPKIKGNFNQTKSYFYTHTNINNINPDEDDNNKKQKKEREKSEPKITKIYRLNKDNKDKENKENKDIEGI